MAGRVDLKVVLLGKEYGGKTSLVERYLHGKFGSIPYQAVSTIDLYRKRTFSDSALDDWSRLWRQDGLTPKRLVAYTRNMGILRRDREKRSSNHASAFLSVQDTAGAERYEAMSRLYYRGAKAAVICFGKNRIVFEPFKTSGSVCTCF